MKLKSRLFPWLTLLLGYVLGHTFYPVLQLRSWSCQCRCPDALSRSAYSRSSLGGISTFETLYSSNSSLITVDSLRLASFPYFNNSEFIKAYLTPSIGRDQRAPHRWSTPRSLGDEYSTRRKLLVAVVTAERYLLTRAKAVYETWGQEVTQVVFFVGADCKTSHPGLEGYPIVKLRGVKDDDYPPQRKVFAALKHIQKHYIDQFHWFMRADDDVYIRGKKLEKLLDSLNPNNLIYLGRAGKGKKQDVARIGLFSHERYCMGGPGIVFSNAALQALAPFLDKCLEAVHFHNSKSQQPWYNEDVELGRCISRTVGVQCSTSAEGRTYFETDYNSAALDPSVFWFSSMFQNLITIHPLKQPQNLYSIHHFYQVKQLESMTQNVQKLQDKVKQLCGKLPKRLAPPKEAGALASCNDAVIIAPTVAKHHSFPKVDNPKSELMPWKYFNASVLHDAIHVVPENGENVHLELSQLFPMLKNYLELNSRLASINISEGYMRYNPFIGQEYILDVRFTPNKARNSDRTKRVRVTRPLSETVTVLPEEGGNIDAYVNTVVPLTGDIDIANMELSTCTDYKEEKAHQILCVIDEGNNIQNVQAVVADCVKKHPHTRVTVVPVTANSTFASIVDSGLSILEEGALVFIGKPNMLINPGFFEACRRNTIASKRIFFPIPSVVNDPKINPTRKLKLAVTPSLDMACVYKADYILISADEGSLFEQALHSKLEVFQAPEPRLVYRHTTSRLQERDQSESWH